MRATTQTHKGDIWSLPSRHWTDVFDLNLPRDHLVPEIHHDRGDKSQSVLSLVGDQDPKMVSLAMTQRNIIPAD